MKTNDGGSAFPIALQDGLTANSYTEPGMTLRDWLAGMALSGVNLSFIGSPSDCKSVARKVCWLADAVLA